MTVQEVEDYWLELHELDRIKESCRQLRQKYPKLNFVDFSKDVKRNDSFRGLELMSDTYKNKRQERYTAAQNAVFTKQREGNLLNGNGELSTSVMIANTIISINEPNQQDAYER